MSEPSREHKKCPSRTLVRFAADSRVRYRLAVRHGAKFGFSNSSSRSNSGKALRYGPMKSFDEVGRRPPCSLAYNSMAKLTINWENAKDTATKKPAGAGMGRRYPAKIVAGYERLRAADPTRPVMLNLGQGVANDDWKGRGSRGLIYFVHQFKPRFNEHALLDDPEMLAAVTAINHQIKELAPVLNSPTAVNGGTVHSSDPASPIDLMVNYRITGDGVGSSAPDGQRP